jgi:hypothetical protein
MAQSLSKDQVARRLSSTRSNTSGEAALASGFRAFVSSNASAVSSVLSAVMSGNWTGAKTAMASVVQTAEFKSLSESAENQGFGSIGLVTAVDGGFILGGKGAAGVLVAVSLSPGFYAYDGLGLSIGVTEGAVLEAGLYLSTESPADAGGTEFFGEMSGDFGAGVAVEGSWSLFGGSGLLILLSTGEEFEVSAGVAHAWVEEI